MCRNWRLEPLELPPQEQKNILRNNHKSLGCHIIYDAGHIQTIQSLKYTSRMPKHCVENVLKPDMRPKLPLPYDITGGANQQNPMKKPLNQGNR